MPENLASQIGNCYNCIVEEDKEISLELAKKTGVDPETFDLELNTLTQAQADITHEFLRYAEVPRDTAEKIVADYKASQANN